MQAKNKGTTDTGASGTGGTVLWGTTLRIDGTSGRLYQSSAPAFNQFPWAIFSLSSFPSPVAFYLLWSVGCASPLVGANRQNLY